MGRIAHDVATEFMKVAVTVASPSYYGARKQSRKAKNEGAKVGREQVSRFMCIAGIGGARRQKRIVTTVPAPVQRELPDLVTRRWDMGVSGRRNLPLSGPKLRVS